MHNLLPAFENIIPITNQSQLIAFYGDTRRLRESVEEFVELAICLFKLDLLHLPHMVGSMPCLLALMLFRFLVAI